jgi:hypothetical protein
VRHGDGNPIPVPTLVAVDLREGGLCLRCWGGGLDHHHRRSRRVADEHQHCPCNVVLLCRHDHSWAHLATGEGRGIHEGLILSSHLASPLDAPVRVMGGWLRLLCDGGVAPLSDDEVVVGPLGHPLVVQRLRSQKRPTP